MNNPNGVLTLLGFAQKGKKLAAGDANVEAYLKKGKVELLIIAADLAENRQKSWRYQGENYDIETVVFSTKQELGLAIGMSPRSIIGITDGKMAKAILHKMNDKNE